MIALAAALLLTAKPAIHTVKTPEFSVMMPGSPSLDHSAKKGKRGDERLYVTSVDPRTGAVYDVSWGFAPADLAASAIARGGYAPAAECDAALDALRDHTLQKDGEHVKEMKLEVPHGAAREWLVRNGTMSALHRVYIVGVRQYHLTVYFSPAHAPGAEMKAFLDSFKLAGAAGQLALN